MIKKPVPVTVSELKEILVRYLRPEMPLNYALKIIGHPGVGKSAVVKEAADELNLLFVDTRLAFKENVDLGGYPVPDHASGRMIYFRPKFIPPDSVPEGRDGILWFLDEANRAHPTVIQTLFQIITEKTCGEHALPENTSIVLAGNLGEADGTTITDFDDTALEGRLALFHLKPSPDEWLKWAAGPGQIHPAVIRYISVFPERLWDEAAVIPNPRGWEQVSRAVTFSYGLDSADSLTEHLLENPDSTLIKLIYSLAGYTAGDDFVKQMTSPRALSSADILSGSSDAMSALTEDRVPAEDLLWAMGGALDLIREATASSAGSDIEKIANFITFAGLSRADIRVSFLFLLMKECGVFSVVPEALAAIKNKKLRDDLIKKYGEFIAE
jgi:hypothetical protein